jgi:hypothetical protein
VCNRTANACIYRVPSRIDDTREIEIEPRAEISGSGTLFARVKNPGSAISYRVADDCYGVLICNNYWNFVSSHYVHFGHSIKLERGGLLSGRSIRIPDGISMSPDKAWVAVSVHARGEVLLYRAKVAHSADSEPVGVLRGVVCPHGSRFVSNDTLVVADAACPYLHVFRRDGDDWAGEQNKPAQSVRVLGNEQFFDGRFAAGEGGVKGLDVDRSGRLLVTTTRLDPVGFFDLTKLLGEQGQLPDHIYAELSSQRDESMQRWHANSLLRRWTPGQRIRHEISSRRNDVWSIPHRAGVKARLGFLKGRNLYSRNQLLDSSGPVVSLTTHGSRINRVHYVLESIGQGQLRPSRLILWLTENETFANLPPALRRLQSRGVEIRCVDEFGPHTKYFPYVESTEVFRKPLVTADDDVLYPSHWLRDLVKASEAFPEYIHCHRVRRMRVALGEPTPYNEWPFGSDDRPTHLNFIMGVGGVLYPPIFLSALKRADRAFTECCPTNDDVWLTVNAIRSRVRVRQVRQAPLQTVTVPGTQHSARFVANALQGSNQVQLRRTFSKDDLAFLLAEQTKGVGQGCCPPHGVSLSCGVVVTQGSRIN